MNQVGSHSTGSCFGANLTTTTTTTSRKWQQLMKKKQEWTPQKQLLTAVEPKLGESSSSSMGTIRSDMARPNKPYKYVSKISIKSPNIQNCLAFYRLHLTNTWRINPESTKQFSHISEEVTFNKGVWRVRMLPIQFFFLTVCLVLDLRLRCTTATTNYKPQITGNESTVLELDTIRCEFRGLDKVLETSNFSLGVKGVLYPDRRLPRNSRLRGQLEMSISFIEPPVPTLVPREVQQNVSKSVLKTLGGNMKHKVNSSLMVDYSKFKKERRKRLM